MTKKISCPKSDSLIFKLLCSIILIGSIYAILYPLKPNDQPIIPIKIINQNFALYSDQTVAIEGYPKKIRQEIMTLPESKTILIIYRLYQEFPCQGDNLIIWKNTTIYFPLTASFLDKDAELAANQKIIVVGKLVKNDHDSFYIMVEKIKASKN